MRLALLLLLCSCSRHTLTVRSELLAPPYLASVQIDTPNPGAKCFFGQQLVIHYRAPQRGAQLNLEIINCEGETQTVSYCLPKRCGFLVHRLECDESLLAFRACLYVDDCLIATETHPLFEERLDLFEPRS